jgi:hypothetical protein
MKKPFSITKFKKDDPRLIGKNNTNWRGDKAGYATIHSWLYRQVGKATFCSFNKEHKASRYEWASKSRKALRDVSDYMPLCPSCHHKYDYTSERKRNTEMAQKKAQSKRATPVTYKGQSKTLREWSEYTGLNISTLRVRRWRGLPPEKILEPISYYEGR